MSSTKVGEVNNNKDVKSTKRIVGISLDVKEKEILKNLLISHIEYMKHHFLNEEAFKDSEKNYRKLIKKITEA